LCITYHIKHEKYIRIFCEFFNVYHSFCMFSLTYIFFMHTRELLNNFFSFIILFTDKLMYNNFSITVRSEFFSSYYYLLTNWKFRISNLPNPPSYIRHWYYFTQRKKCLLFLFSWDTMPIDKNSLQTFLNLKYLILIILS